MNGKQNKEMIDSDFAYALDLNEQEKQFTNDTKDRLRDNFDSILARQIEVQEENMQVAKDRSNFNAMHVSQVKKHEKNSGMAKSSNLFDEILAKQLSLQEKSAEKARLLENFERVKSDEILARELSEYEDCSGMVTSLKKSARVVIDLSDSPLQIKAPTSVRRKTDSCLQQNKQKKKRKILDEGDVYLTYNASGQGSDYNNLGVKVFKGYLNELIKLRETKYKDERPKAGASIEVMYRRLTGFMDHNPQFNFRVMCQGSSIADKATRKGMVKLLRKSGGKLSDNAILRLGWLAHLYMTERDDNHVFEWKAWRTREGFLALHEISYMSWKSTDGERLFPELC